MFEQVVVVGGPVVPTTSKEVDAAEARLGLRFPRGYRRFITTFGEGVLGGSFLRIYPPHRILNGPGGIEEWRERIDEYWFWDDGAGVLSKTRALESCIIGDTLDGDELIFHPSEPDRIYVLPRHSDTIFVAGDGLPEAIEWLCASGTLTEPFTDRDFEPFDSRS